VTTHDLPTVAGLWTGADLRAQKDIGLVPNEEGTGAMRERLRQLTGATDETAAEDVIAGAHRLLAEAPSAVLTATLEDAGGVAERPNVPGTIFEWPNWSLALPVPIEELETAPLARRIASNLRREPPAASHRPG
jgi:4-alpha-glucanotransferase